MVATNEVPKTVVADGMVRALQTQGGPKKAVQNSPSKKEEKSCLKSWSFQVSSPGGGKQGEGSEPVGRIS